MEQGLELTKEEIRRLKLFHEAHFPNQPVPALEPTSTPNHTVTAIVPNTSTGEDLGFYEDGVRRTLTDDQIAMFRNSEIQRIIQNRSKEAEKKKDEQRKNKHGKKREYNNNDSTGPAESKTWTRHFDEAPKGVDTLMYDDEPAAAVQQEAGPKKFMWPQLG